MVQVRLVLQSVQAFLQLMAMCVLALTASICSTWSILAAFGITSWPDIGFVGVDGTVVPAGHYLLPGLAGLSLLLLVFLPGSLRVLRLETSHRRFELRMEDVARAYHTAHAADRAGYFRAKSEFDAVKERLVFLRRHPDLAGLEPEVLEIAAQMSRTSEELAQIYSDENVNRARDFLQQRQEEVERFNDRLDAAKACHVEIKSWLARVEMDEAVAASQLERLKEEIASLLPSENTGNGKRSDTGVIHLPTLAAE